MGFKGIDIYSETIITDWNAIKTDGVEAVYIKATEGLNYVNPLIDSQYNNAKNRGLKVGFYHFASRNAVAAEYKHFMDTIEKYQQDLKPVLDYEVANPDMNFVAAFMALNPGLLLYAAHNIADKSGLPKNKIWIAEPGANSNDTKGYAGLQYSWTGRVAGTQGNMDIDLFSSEVLIDVNNNNVVLVAAPQAEQQQGDPTVRIIQMQLNTVMKSNLKVDSVKGTLTTGTINEFKKAMGLKENGVWDSDCVKAITEIYARPEDSKEAPHYEYATRYIQYRVGSGGDTPGYFSNGTKVCLQNWQAAHGLRPDSVTGTNTWKKLLDENV